MGEHIIKEKSSDTHQLHATPITCYTTAPIYHIIIICDTVVRQKRNIKHYNN